MWTAAYSFAASPLASPRHSPRAPSSISQPAAGRPKPQPRRSRASPCAARYRLPGGGKPRDRDPPRSQSPTFATRPGRSSAWRSCRFASRPTSRQRHSKVSAPGDRIAFHARDALAGPARDRPHLAARKASLGDAARLGRAPGLPPQATPVAPSTVTPSVRALPLHELAAMPRAEAVQRWRDERQRGGRPAAALVLRPGGAGHDDRRDFAG